MSGKQFYWELDLDEELSALKSPRINTSCEDFYFFLNLCLILVCSSHIYQYCLYNAVKAKLYIYIYIYLFLPPRVGERNFIFLEEKDAEINLSCMCSVDATRCFHDKGPNRSEISVLFITEALRSCSNASIFYVTC